MTVIHFDNEHQVGVEETVREIHDKIVNAGAAYTPLIQVHRAGEENVSTINAHAIRIISKY